MSSRIFQGVIVQMKDATTRCIGVVDEQGFVIACSELSMIGSRLDDFQAAVGEVQEQLFATDTRTYKILSASTARFEYAVFVEGNDQTARSICILAAVGMTEASTNFEEKHNKAAFVKNIISDNILPGDVYVRAKELHFTTDVPRAVLLVRQVNVTDIAVLELIQNMFPDRQHDFVLSVSESDIVVIKEMTPDETSEDICALAESIERAVHTELHVQTVIGIGTTANHLREPTAIRRRRSPSRSARYLKTRSRSFTTITSASAASFISCRRRCARCSCPKRSRKTPSRRSMRTRSTRSIASLRITSTFRRRRVSSTSIETLWYTGWRKSRRLRAWICASLRMQSSSRSRSW